MTEFAVNSHARSIEHFKHQFLARCDMSRAFFPDTYCKNLCNDLHDPRQCNVVKESSNACMRKLIGVSSTNIVKFLRVKSAHEKDKEFGLLELFPPDKLFDDILN